MYGISCEQNKQDKLATGGSQDRRGAKRGTPEVALEVGIRQLNAKVSHEMG